MNSNLNKISIIQKIEQSSPVQLAALPEVADRFKQLYSIMNGKNADVAAVVYESEKFHFMKLLSDKPDLHKCTKIFVLKFGQFKKVIYIASILIIKSLKKKDKSKSITFEKIKWQEKQHFKRFLTNSAKSITMKTIIQSVAVWMAQNLQAAGMKMPAMILVN